MKFGVFPVKILRQQQKKTFPTWQNFFGGLAPPAPPLATALILLLDWRKVILTDGVLDTDHSSIFFVWYNFINK